MTRIGKQELKASSVTRKKRRVAPYLDEDGKVLEGSIAEKVFVEINGVQQGMFLKGTDTGKPVMLLVHGGPGMSDYFLSKEYPTDLEEEFVVCYWEQRGTGLSYHSDIPPESMTAAQFVSDTLAVTEYLKTRFGQEKIYLVGHSWGSFISIQAAAESPESYHAYIAMSQSVDQSQSEKLSYTFMLEQYKAIGDSRMVKKLETLPVLESEEAFKEYRMSLLRDEAMHELGVGTMRNMKSVISGIFYPSLRCTDYTPKERINIWRGKVFSGKTGLRDELFDFNAMVEVLELEIPVYFFAGQYDYTCMYSLQREYYEQLQAPVKRFYTFSESAHSPLFEEPAKAMTILRELVAFNQSV
jgi:pimeloyl-ACP methyl ester carboxylesterase